MKKHEREDRVIDRLECENRELKSSIRVLQRRLGRISKGVREFKDKEPEETPIKKEEPKEILCLECRQGIIIEVEILGRIIGTCNFCEVRQPTKKRKQKIS